MRILMFAALVSGASYGLLDAVRRPTVIEWGYVAFAFGLLVALVWARWYVRHEAWGTLKLSDLRAGDIVQVNDSFDCVAPGSKHKIEEDNYGGLHFWCYLNNKRTQHYLVGQEDSDGFLRGVRRS